MKPLPAKFSQEDFNKAYEVWGANCGPAAIATILHKNLEEIRPHLGNFEQKHYTNPTLMHSSLDSLGASWKKSGKIWPVYGLVRIQWEGPWTDPKAHHMAKQRYTHWVGAAIVEGRLGIFDVNCLNNGTGWVSFDDWKNHIVPYLVKLYPNADGNWHIANSIEIG